jgi:hypothetical protein
MAPDQGQVAVTNGCNRCSGVRPSAAPELWVAVFLKGRPLKDSSRPLDQDLRPLVPAALALPALSGSLRWSAVPLTQA